MPSDTALDLMLSIGVAQALRAETDSALQCRLALRAMDRRIIVLAPSRSGSEYFGYLLRDLGIDCEEFLTVGSSVARERAMPEGADEAAFIASVCRKAPNLIFCSKELVHRLLPLFGVGELPQHLADWHFIQIVRRNVVRQAISLFVAQRTGQWRGDVAPQAHRAFDEITFSAIASLNEIFIARQRIERFLGIFAIISLTVYFEDLLEAPKREMAHVSAFLDLASARLEPLPPPFKSPPTRQGTGLNAEIEQAFRQEFSRRCSEGREKVEVLLSVKST